jgi:hypothetical protein
MTFKVLTDDTQKIICRSGLCGEKNFDFFNIVVKLLLIGGIEQALEFIL